MSEEKSTYAVVIDAADRAEADPDRQPSAQINEALRDVVRAAQNSGQPGSVTIDIKVKPGPERRVEFAVYVKGKLPRPPTSAVTLYAGADGSVHRSDPAQGRLALETSTRTSKDN